MDAKMTEAEKKVRAYLAEIGRRGGITSRRDLTQIARATDGCYP
jgi:hypothetical protein